MYVTTPYPSAYVLAKFCSFPPLLDAPKEQAASCLQEGILLCAQTENCPCVQYRTPWGVHLPKSRIYPVNCDKCSRRAMGWLQSQHK